MAEAEKDKLTGAQRFFANVYHMRMNQQQFFRIVKAIKAETDEGKIEKMKAQRDEFIRKSKLFEKAVDEQIDVAEREYEKKGLTKFWT